MSKDYVKTLYKRNVNGSVQQWTIGVSGDIYASQSGQVGGVITASEPTKCFPKNVGKKNETTAEEQALFEAAAKVKAKIDKGHYFEDINKIDEELFVKPILAKKWDDHKHKIDYSDGVWSDPKMDGGRGVFSFRGLQSRTGKNILAVPHIVNSLGDLLKVYPDLHLDGELYNHELRYNLNRIMSLIRKTKNLTPEALAESRKMVQYWVFDGWGFEGVTKDTPFGERKAKLWDLLAGYYRSIVLVKSRYFTSKEEVDGHYEDLVKHEFEGQILRWGDTSYVNKRTDKLLKRKDFMDDEFEVVAFEEGKGNKKGMAATAICITNNDSPKGGGIRFGVGLNGTEDFVKEVWENQSKWVGKKGHVRFLNYSEYGKPIIGKLITFRHDLV